MDAEFDRDEDSVDILPVSGTDRCSETIEIVCETDADTASVLVSEVIFTFVKPVCIMELVFVVSVVISLVVVDCVGGGRLSIDVTVEVVIRLTDDFVDSTIDEIEVTELICLSVIAGVEGPLLDVT